MSNAQKSHREREKAKARKDKHEEKNSHRQEENYYAGRPAAFALVENELIEEVRGIKK